VLGFAATLGWTVKSASSRSQPFIPQQRPTRSSIAENRMPSAAGLILDSATNFFTSRMTRTVVLDTRAIRFYRQNHT